MTSVLNLDQRVNVTIDSPVGPITLVAGDGALTGLYMLDQRHRPPADTFGTPSDTRLFDETREQLAAYFAGELTTFTVPLAPQGTDFQRRVWRGLCDIPYGGTISYGELARRLNQPTAARAVGLANGRNPIGIIIPCHRVIGANGAMTGYGGGLDRKRFLLDLEKPAGQAPSLFD